MAAMGPATKEGRRLVKVETRAAARGQLHKTRVHLVVPEERFGHVNGVAALCGARPEYGFTQSVTDRGPDRDCPRCLARVKPDDRIET